MPSLSTLAEMPLLPITSVQTVAACRALPVTNRDIFICSYPKSGTTWTQNLVCRLLAAHLNMELSLDNWHLSQSAPFYEVDQYWDDTGNRKPCQTPLQSSNEDSKVYRVFNTHLRPDQLPPTAKCVYVMRDPLDVLTSFYHHLVNMAEQDGGYKGSPEQFCTDFLQGTVLYGKWQDHMEAWLGSTAGGNSNEPPSSQTAAMLLLHYDDMKRELRQEATRLAQFLGVENERLDKVVDSALPHCTFEAMRRERWRYTPLSVQWKIDETTGKSYDDFVRTGRNGDGNFFIKKYFTENVQKQWQDDSEIAKHRWTQAGVPMEIIEKYLN